MGEMGEAGRGRLLFWDFVTGFCSGTGNRELKRSLRDKTVTESTLNGRIVVGDSPVLSLCN
jgi:hypothetical protein